MKVEMIEHGNCAVCGKELNKSSGFCKDCETKIIESLAILTDYISSEHGEFEDEN